MGEQQVIWQQLATCLAGLLDKQGLEIVHPFSVQLFNAQGCPQEHQLPPFDRSSTLGVVIGNTNSLWPSFVQHLVAHPDALDAANPLDDYIESVISQAVQQCWQQVMPAQQPRQQCPGCASQQQQDHQQHGLAPKLPDMESQQHQVGFSSTEQLPDCPNFAVRFSHHTEQGRFVNMMRAAQHSGLAYYSNTTHLCMHPTYGPWFALRAVAVFNTDGPDPAGFSQLQCPYPDLEAEAAQKVGRPSLPLLTLQNAKRST